MIQMAHSTSMLITATSIQVLSENNKTKNSAPMNMNSQPANRCVLSHDNLLDSVQGVRTPQNQFGRILLMKFPITMNNTPVAGTTTVDMFTWCPNAPSTALA